jgi:hypothetical protein
VSFFYNFLFRYLFLYLKGRRVTVYIFISHSISMIRVVCYYNFEF